MFASNHRCAALLAGVSPVDRIALGAVAVGAVFVAVGILTAPFAGPGEDGAGLDAALRGLGGVLLLGGIGALALGTPRRRDRAARAARLAARGYMARTAHWNPADRWGLAAVLLGLAGGACGVVLYVLFGPGVGNAVVVPSLLAFAGGAFTLIAVRFMRDRKDGERRGRGGGR